jgi:hypothetical protein
MTEITVYVHGPLFDGRANRMVDHMCTGVQQEVAHFALDRWQLNAEQTFKEPTGAYQEHMQVAKRDGADVVTDGWPESGLEYGLWLEGLGKRNKTTRFKGYWNLKRAFEFAQQRWLTVAQPVVDKWVGRINSD